ncbi:MAG: hypothetical protein GEU28_04275 [Dehalococcoidia bacterium]|nr:hypothetical protein [Dehalococcoidia bacterium]
MGDERGITDRIKDTLKNLVPDQPDQDEELEEHLIDEEVAQGEPTRTRDGEAINMAEPRGITGSVSDGGTVEAPLARAANQELGAFETGDVDLAAGRAPRPTEESDEIAEERMGTEEDFDETLR